MEVKNCQRLTLLAALILFMAPALFSHPKTEREDDRVRLMKAESIELLEKNGQQFRKAIKSTFLHNGTYLISDTALWNLTTKKIQCWGHVKMIQDETILTSEKLDYDIDANLAKFEGSLVQLQNKKRNLLRTKYLTYNTKDSIAVFNRGGAMRDENGQLIESYSGEYSSRFKRFMFREDVNMFTDSVFIRTTLLYYYSDQEKAQFPNPIDFWKGPNILSASNGWYTKGDQTYFFRDRVHGITEAQEFWSDTLYFYSIPQDAILLGHAQVQDTSRDVAAMANRIHYRDSIKQVELQGDAAVVLFTENSEKRDTLYIGADKLRYTHTRFCDIPEATVSNSKTRLNDILTDAVSQLRAKTAADRAAASAELKKRNDAVARRQARMEQKEASTASSGGRPDGGGGGISIGGGGDPGKRGGAHEGSGGRTPNGNRGGGPGNKNIGNAAGNRNNGNTAGNNSAPRQQTRSSDSGGGRIVPDMSGSTSTSQTKSEGNTASNGKPTGRQAGQARAKAGSKDIQPAIPEAQPDTTSRKQKPAGSQTDTLAKLTAKPDSLTAPLDSMLAVIDSLASQDKPAGVPDSLAFSAPADSLGTAAALADSLAATDSLAMADSLAEAVAPLDTTRYGFGLAVGNVKIFRREIQVRCDSMLYCDLDSIARFYKDPIVWNDERRQYTADSLHVLVGGGGARKASLQSNAFVITQDDEICFDQIKGAEIMAYFDSTTNTLQRFDALGGASALFYLQENGALATVNKVESKMLSARLKDGAIDQVYYFDNPHNDAYPTVQLPQSDSRMKGFQWRPEDRLTCPEDVTTIQLRRSDRKASMQKAQPSFKQADIYFPGYIPGIRKEIAEREALARRPKPRRDTAAPEDTLKADLGLPVAQADSIAANAINLLEHADSVALLGDTPVRDSLGNIAPKLDSISTAKDSLSHVRDSLRTKPVEEEIDPLSIPTVDPKQKKIEERERRRAMRIAARDARIAAREARIAEREKRWAQLDSLDAAKAAAKQQKLLERERARKLRQLKALEKQEAREQAKLERYIEKYRKQYERKQKSLAARKRTQAPETGGEVPAPDEPEPQATGGDAILGDDGSPDDDPVLGSGGLPGP